MIVYIPFILAAIALLALVAPSGFRMLALRHAKRAEIERKQAEIRSLAECIDLILIDLYAELLIPGASCSRHGSDLAWRQPSEHPETDWHIALSGGVDETQGDLLRITRGGPQGPGLVARIVPGQPMGLAMTDGSSVPEEKRPGAALNALRLHRRLIELRPRTEAGFRMRVRSQLQKTAAVLAQEFLRQPRTDAFRDRSGSPNSLRARILDQTFGFWDARIDVHASGRTDVSLEHAETGLSMAAQFYLGRFELFKPSGRSGNPNDGVLPHPEDADLLEELFIRLYGHLWPGPVGMRAQSV